MWKRLYVNYSLFLSDFNETWIFWTCFRKTQISDSIKIRPAEAELFHADGRTKKLIIISFRNFANAPGHSTFCPHNVFVCFVWIWEQTAIISLYSISWLDFITETECVYGAVRSAHTVYLCVLCGSENKQRLILLYSINWLVFITEMECVYCPVRAESSDIQANRTKSLVSGLTTEACVRSRFSLCEICARQSGNGTVFRFFSVSIIPVVVTRRTN
jgi:hypothetical protein